jgi:ABC-type lipoprotein release transport system permease subunit
MSVWRLVGREISYRKVDFALGALAVFVAVGCLVAVMTLLRAHGSRVAEMNAEQAAETTAMMALNEDEYRKIMKEMGYNILILSRDQDLAEFYAKGFASKPMPEEFVSRLTNSSLLTVQHLLPTLYAQMAWPEQNGFPIVLIGVRGEVLHLHSNKGEPMLEPVERGAMRIGHQIQARLGLKVGDTVTLLGRAFQVAEVQDERGNTDDISVWIHLSEAQELLHQPQQVSAILALSCFCAGSELERVRQEIAAILPEAQVIQRVPQALARSQARNRAAELTAATTTAEAGYHARLNQEREALASWLIPLVILGATVWIGLLAWGNVRTRRVEIAVLRALGLRSRQILAVFLAKALVIGLAGASLGYLSGFCAGAAWSAWEQIPVSAERLAGMFDPVLLLSVLVLAPLQACVASWIPAMLAAQQDPAMVLREE